MNILCPVCEAVKGTWEPAFSGQAMPDLGMFCPEHVPKARPAASVSDILLAAFADVGLAEVAPNVVLGLADHEPWCALWLCRVLRRAGLDVPVVAGAKALLRHLGENYESIPHDGPFDVGDVIGWDRLDEAGAAVGQHVAIYLGLDGADVVVISGNSGPKADRVWAGGRHPRALVKYAARVAGLQRDRMRT